MPLSPPGRLRHTIPHDGDLALRLRLSNSVECHPNFKKLAQSLKRQNATASLPSTHLPPIPVDQANLFSSQLVLIHPRSPCYQ